MYLSLRSRRRFSPNLVSLEGSLRDSKLPKLRSLRSLRGMLFPCVASLRSGVFAHRHLFSFFEEVPVRSLVYSIRSVPSPDHLVLFFSRSSKSLGARGPGRAPPRMQASLAGAFQAHWASPRLFLAEQCFHLFSC